MAESKSDGTKQVGQGGGKTVVIPKDQAEKVEPPVEIKSKGGGITIIKEGDEYTIRFAPMVAEEIGSYRRANVSVKFKEGEQLAVIPDVTGL